MSIDINIKRMKELVKNLNIASEAYYNTGNPILSDKDFDLQFDELKQLEKELGIVLNGSPTQKVGATILPELKEVKHNHLMLSLDKCHTVEELIKFAKDKTVVGMSKMDGMSVSILYQDGELVSAETRGDGEIGVDITEHIKQFLNVPLHIPCQGTCIIDGEAIIDNLDFEEINENGEYKNSRNLACGTLNSLDTSIVKERKLKFIAWDVIEGMKTNSLVANLMFASKLGFEIVPVIVTKDNQFQQTIDEISNCSKEKGYPIDGVVFKFDDIEFGESLGNTEHHFRNGIAYKFEDEGKTTDFINVTWSVGKTGVITPVANFMPVTIEGSVVERASVHNLSILQELKLEAGDEIEVYKANMIIPQIRKNISAEQRKDKYICIYPKKCPVCGGKTTVKHTYNVVTKQSTDVLMCNNPNCKGKLLSRFSHFVSKNAMNIDGLSEAKLKILLDEDFINDFIDIYELYNNFGETGDVAKLNGFGKRSAEKLFNAIEASKNTTLDRFIFALSIPMIGRTASKTISSFFKGDFISFYEALQDKQFNWMQLDDFGEAMDSSIKEYINKDMLDFIWELSTYLNFQKNNNITQGNKVKDITFVITGKLFSFANRDEAKEMIESNGGKVANAVSKNTNYLVNNDILSTSGKNKKAKQLNIPIITEEELLKMLK